MPRKNKIVKKNKGDRFIDFVDNIYNVKQKALMKLHGGTFLFIDIDQIDGYKINRTMWMHIVDFDKLTVRELYNRLDKKLNPRIIYTLTSSGKVLRDPDALLLKDLHIHPYGTIIFKQGIYVRWEAMGMDKGFIDESKTKYVEAGYQLSGLKICELKPIKLNKRFNVDKVTKLLDQLKF